MVLPIHQLYVDKFRFLSCEVKKIIIKYRYKVSDTNLMVSLFFGNCIFDDIIKVIQLFRVLGCSIWNIEKKTG